MTPEGVALNAPADPNWLEGSKTRAVNAQLSAFAIQLEIYQLDLGEYPTTQQGLAALHTPPANLPDRAKWQGPYAKKAIPLDAWSNPYCYESVSPAQYRIYSAGSDGIPNTGDDICQKE